MILKHMRVFGLVGLIISSSPVVATKPSSVEGVWITQHNKAVVRIFGCGGALCGTIVRPGGAAIPWPVTDNRNANPSLRDRPLIGLQIISNLRPNRDDWKGELYSPEDGRSYKANFERQNNGSLKVRGCWAFICESYIWSPAK